MICSLRRTLMERLNNVTMVKKLNETTADFSHHSGFFSEHLESSLLKSCTCWSTDWQLLPSFEVIHWPDFILPLLFSLISPLQCPHLLFLCPSFSLHPVTQLSNHNLEDLKGCNLISLLLFSVSLSGRQTFEHRSTINCHKAGGHKCNLNAWSETGNGQSSKQSNTGQPKHWGNQAQSSTLKRRQNVASCLHRQGNKKGTPLTIR